MAGGFLPPAVQQYIADVEKYVNPVQKAQRETEKLALDADKAGIAADRAMKKAGDAAKQAAVAQQAAAEAADKLAKGEIAVDEAARLAAEAVDKLRDANILERESSIAAAAASDKQRNAYMEQSKQAAMAQAAIYLANLKAMGSVRDHQKAVEDLTKKFPELKTVAADAIKIEQTLVQQATKQFSNFATTIVDGIKNLGPLTYLIIGGIIDTLPVLGGAVTTVLGGAFGALGMIVQAHTANVKKELGNFVTWIKGQAKDVTEPFNYAWQSVLVSAINSFNQIKPALTDMFGSIAPALAKFTNDLGNAFQQMEPLFISLGDSFRVVMADLGPKLPIIFNNLATAVKAFVDEAAAHPQDIANFLIDLSQLVRYAADAVAALAPLASKLQDVGVSIFGVMHLVQYFSMGVKDLIPGLDKSSNSLQIGGGSFQTFAGAAGAAGSILNKTQKAAIQPMVTALNTQRMSVDQLKQAWDKLTGANQSAATAEINMHQAIADTTAAIKQNGQTLDLNTQKGRDNYRQLISTAQAFQDDINAMKNSNATSSQLQTRMNELRQEFYRFALQMTGNRKEAQALTNNLLGIAAATKGIPRTVRQDFYQVVHVSMATSSDLAQGRKTYAKGGYVQGYADGGSVRDPVPGGFVTGPGTGSSDSIPALLSNGEFVVNAQQTKKHLALLQAINKGIDGFARGGGPVKHGPGPTRAFGKLAFNAAQNYAESHAALTLLNMARRGGLNAGWGLLGGIGTNASGVVQHVTNVNLYVAGTVRSDRDLKDYIQQVTLQTNLRNPTSGVNLPAGRVGGI